MSSKPTMRRSRLAWRSCTGPSSTSWRRSRRRDWASWRSRASRSASKAPAASKKGWAAQGCWFFFSLAVRLAAVSKTSLSRLPDAAMAFGLRQQLIPFVRRPSASVACLVAVAVEPGQCLGDAGNDVLAPALPDRACSVVRSLQSRGIDRCRIAFDAGRPDHARQRLAGLAAQQLGVALGRILLRQQIGRQRRRQAGRGHVAAPEVAGGRGQQLRIVGQQLLRQRHAGRERRVVQRPLGKAVDGEDGRFVEVLDRGFQALDHVRIGQRVAGAQAVQQLVGEDIAGGAAPLQPRQHLHHALADALAQFGRGGDGEGDDQDLLHLEPLLQHQAQVEAADGPGLAGAGRGLDQVRACQRAGEDVERDGGCGRHGPAPSSSTGWKTATASS